MTVQNLYTQYLDGKITKQKFLYEVRRDQHLDMISSSNSFEDVVKILKNKSIISEKAHKEAKKSEGKQEVDIIAKTIDMVNPYEYTRGMNYELDIMDVPATSGDLSEDNVLKAQKKVLTNLTKNPQYYYEKLNGKGEVSDEWVEATKKEIDKIGKGKKNIMREGYSAVLDLPNGYYFAIDGDWEDEYQGKNGMFFTISGNNIYDKDGESIQSSPREFLSQFTPEEILKVSSPDKKNTMREGIFEGGFISRGAILKALSDVGSASEIRQYLTSLEKSGDEFETIDDYIEDFRNYIADKGLDEGGNLGHNEISSIHPEGAYWVVTYRGPKGTTEKSFRSEEEARKFQDGLNEHGQYADRVADVNADSTPLKEREEAIYEKYAQKFNKSIDEVKSMVQEAKAKNLQEADDTPEEKKAKDLSIAAEKAKIAASNKRIQDLNQGK